MAVPTEGCWHRRAPSTKQEASVGELEFGHTVRTVLSALSTTVVVVAAGTVGQRLRVGPNAVVLATGCSPPLRLSRYF